MSKAIHRATDLEAPLYLGRGTAEVRLPGRCGLRARPASIDESLDSVFRRPEGVTMRNSLLVHTLSAVLVTSAAGSGLDSSYGAAPVARASQPRHLSLVADHHTEYENAKGLTFTERLRRGRSVIGSVAGRCSY